MYKYLTVLLCFFVFIINGIKTEAQEKSFPDLVLSLLETSDKTENIYYPKKVNPELTAELAKKDVVKYLKTTFSDEHESAYFNDTIPVRYNNIKNKTIVCTDDYFEFETAKLGIIRINFRDILFEQIVHSTTPVFDFDHSCYMQIGKHRFGTCASPELDDAIFFLRDRFEQKMIEEQMKEFEKIAEEERKSPKQHEMTEQQRKLFIQGNAMVEAKQAPMAMKLYSKAVAIDPLSYPEGYYNMALVAGAIEKYRYAIFCMKKYVMLARDAEDLQSAKDKIYEWEALRDFNR